MLCLWELTHSLSNTQQVGFHRPGSLRLLTTPGRVDEAKYQLQRQGWHQSPMTLLSPAEVQELMPIMNCSDVLGGLFTPGVYKS